MSDIGTDLLKQYVQLADEKAFNTLFEKYYRFVFLTCYRILQNHSDSEDATQATFLVLARKAKQIHMVSVAGWLHSVASNISMRFHSSIQTRTKYYKAFLKNKDTGRNENTIDEIYCDSDQDLRSRIDIAICSLPESYRIPIQLFHLEQKSIKEISILLGCNTSTIAMRLNRGRKILGKRLNNSVALTIPFLHSLLFAHQPSIDQTTFALSEKTQKLCDAFINPPLSASKIITSNLIYITSALVIATTLVVSIYLKSLHNEATVLGYNVEAILDKSLASNPFFHKYAIHYQKNDFILARGTFKIQEKFSHLTSTDFIANGINLHQKNIQIRKSKPAILQADLSNGDLDINYIFPSKKPFQVMLSVKVLHAEDLENFFIVSPTLDNYNPNLETATIPIRMGTYAKLGWINFQLFLLNVGRIDGNDIFETEIRMNGSVQSRNWSIGTPGTLRLRGSGLVEVGELKVFTTLVNDSSLSRN